MHTQFLVWKPLEMKPLWRQRRMMVLWLMLGKQAVKVNGAWNWLTIVSNGGLPGPATTGYFFLPVAHIEER